MRFVFVCEGLGCVSVREIVYMHYVCVCVCACA